MADVVGDLVYEAAIDSGKFDAGLAKLENNAKKAANNVDKAAQKVAALRQQLEELQAVAENEKKTRSTGTVSQETGDAIQKTTQQLKMAQLNLESSQIAQEKASAAVSEYVGKQRLAALTTQNVSEQFKKFTKRIAGLAKRVFIFTMITKALRTMRKMLLSTIGADKQMSTSLAQIRGNLISAFAPIYNYILPAIRTLLAWLAKLTAVVSVFINSLFGKTASQADASAKALYNQASATEAAGDAAEKAKKQLEAGHLVRRRNLICPIRSTPEKSARLQPLSASCHRMWRRWPLDSLRGKSERSSWGICRKQSSWRLLSRGLS